MPFFFKFIPSGASDREGHYRGNTPMEKENAKSPDDRTAQWNSVIKKRAPLLIKNLIFNNIKAFILDLNIILMYCFASQI